MSSKSLFIFGLAENKAIRLSTTNKTGIQRTPSTPKRLKLLLYGKKYVIMIVRSDRMERVIECIVLPIVDNFDEVFKLNGMAKRIWLTKEEINKMYERPKITSERLKI